MGNELFKGVCTALVTPMADGSVNTEMLETLLQRQLDAGVQAICVCSTTGEGATLTEREFITIVSRTVRICKGHAKVLVGTGCNDTAKSVARSEAADAMGADGILTVTPYYNKATEAGLVRHFTAVADAVSCPVILYNVPSRTNVDIPLTVYAELAKHPNIAGVKEASGDLGKTAALIAQGYNVWSGNDDQIVPMMALGGKGVISVLSNLLPSEVCTMVNSCLLGQYEAAGRLQCRYAKLIAALFSQVNPIPIKAALNMAGLDVGDPRLPLCPMDADKAAILKEIMANT